MKLIKTLPSLLIAVTATLPLAACGGSAPPTPPPTEAPAPSPTVTGEAVHPQRGFTTLVIKGENGKLKCDDKVATTKLRLGGTVSQNEVNITAEKSEAGITIHFEGGNPFAKSLIVNGDTPGVVPAAAQGSNARDLSLSAKDFGDITSVVLCGGGM